jgi:hypothetical protein
MHQQSVFANVVDVFVGNFEVVDCFRTGARGNRAGQPDLAVDRDDLLAEPQFTGRNDD